MDAIYLKNNVYAALTEALTSMAVALPDDKVEYMGRYLLRYVERKKKREIEEEETKELMQREMNEHMDQKAKETLKAALDEEKVSNLEILIKNETDAFAEVNKGLAKELSNILASMSIAEASALAYVPPPVTEEVELELDEDGNPIPREEPPAPVPVPEPEPEVEPEVEPSAEGEGEEGGQAPTKSPAVKVKDMENAQKTLSVWNNLFAEKSSTAVLGLQSLSQWTPTPITGVSKGYTTPMDQRVILLFHHLAIILGYPTGLSLDPITREPSWSQIRMRIFPTLIQKLSTYDATLKVTVTKEASGEVIKENLYKNLILDESRYPAWFPITTVLIGWIVKAIAARGLAVIYNVQLGDPIEIVEEVTVANEDEDE
mmetsp:Transcript_1104/g.1242  ORF Transcript_1104/g.1242 Transcript_1104/m.1242 type:complete len:373 (+) Transcript_1104:116-1234(+)|eukprot:CAMPEP_0119035532 /NCGR_PEP_ID=MMETSP1177-20130426/2588_1 /TAXON_ID=2985 /ORGANISM="Ochromonas sp, Strain CCMP1899" /LENGTH=372 /DNA_ID=CAMNT_0006993909 /DNA_START=115 /DNA_END=1233 /DNA_ORIENTATION=-